MSLDPEAARRSFAQRFSVVADRIRGIPVKLGLRSKRVFLVWTHWTGEERGEGDEFVLARVELQPTPLVSDLSSVSRRPYSIGWFAEGSIRCSEISSARYTYDQLTGLEIPTDAVRERCASCCGPVAPLGGAPVNPSGPCFVERVGRADVDFWWEIVEDGRGDQPPIRFRYRILGGPSRDEEGFQWVVNLEAASEALSRDGRPNIGPDQDTRGLVGTSGPREVDEDDE